MHIERHEKKDEVGIEFNKWLQKGTEIYKPIQHLTSKRTFIETHNQFKVYFTYDLKNSQGNI